MQIMFAAAIPQAQIMARRRRIGQVHILSDLACELKDRYTVVMVTHNMQQAARISDNTAFFLLGELVEFGKTEQVFSTPADKRTEDYITGRFG